MMGTKASPTGCKARCDLALILVLRPLRSRPGKLPWEDRARKRNGQALLTHNNNQSAPGLSSHPISRQPSHQPTRPYETRPTRAPASFWRPKRAHGAPGAGPQHGHSAPHRRKACSGLGQIRRQRLEGVHPRAPEGGQEGQAIPRRTQGFELCAFSIFL